MSQFWKFSVAATLGFNLVIGSHFAHPRSANASMSSPSNVVFVAQSTNIAQMEDQVLAQINEQRHTYGLDPLQLNRQLSLVARSHSQQMAKRNFYGHIDHQGRNHRGRVEASGLQADVIGENLMKCIHAPDPAGLSVQSWMDSPDHRQNILLSQMQETGVGIWRQGETYYVTQLYMEPK